MYKLKFSMFLLLIFVFILAHFNCSDNITDNPKQNLPPETDVFISYKDTLNYTPSVQTIYWDGTDPDGFVVGFYYSWKENPTPGDWVFTTERSLTFPLQITGEDTIYTFQVKSLDDDGSEDPTPARQRFPIKNSAPEIKWTQLSNIPDTTFTVASFIWEVSDLDGDSTVIRFEYALDDTSQWHSISGVRRSVILNADSGLTTGDHAFYLRAVDNAGAVSNTLRMPDNPSRFWHVKEPKGRYLIIDDFEVENSTVGFPDRYYRQMMENVMVSQGENYSFWNIRELFPAFITQFKETIKLFDNLIWYSAVSTETDDHFITAQLVLPEFLNNGGKVIFSTSFKDNFGTQGDPLDFTPVAEVSSESYRSFPNNVYTPDSLFAVTFPGARPLPQLKVSETIVGIKGLVPKASSVPVYRFQGNDNPIFVLIGRNDNTGEYDFVFSATQLHQLKKDNNLDDFFDIIFNDIFK